VTPQGDVAVAELEDGGHAEGGALTAAVMPYLGPLDQDGIAVFQKLMDGRRDARQRPEAELELGPNGLPPDGRRRRVRHIFIDAAFGAPPRHGGEIEAVEIDEQPAQLIGVCAHRALPSADRWVRRKPHATRRASSVSGGSSCTKACGISRKVCS